MRAAIAFVLAFATLLAGTEAQELLGSSGGKEILECKLVRIEGCDAAKAAPIIEGALRNACPEEPVECAPVAGEAAISVTAPSKAMPLAEALAKAIASLSARGPRERSPEERAFASLTPRFMPPSALAKALSTLPEAGSVLVDLKAGSVKWSGSKLFMEEAARLAEEADKPQAQTKIAFNAYRFNERAVKSLARAVAKAPSGQLKLRLAEALASRVGVDRVAKAECSAVQGFTSSASVLDAKALKVSISVSHPVLEPKGGGAVSIYGDFILDWQNGASDVRGFVRNGAETPLAAFVLPGVKDGKPSFLDLAGLENILKEGLDAPPGELLLIVGSALPGGE